MDYNMDVVICEEQVIQYWVWWQVRCGAVDREVFESVRACVVELVRLIVS